MSSQDLEGFVYNNPEARAIRSYAHALGLVIQHVIVKEKPLNLEKATSSVQSILLLIYV